MKAEGSLSYWKMSEIEPVLGQFNLIHIYTQYTYIRLILIFSSRQHLDLSTRRDDSGRKFCTYFSFILWPPLQYIVKDA
jgi:hypothetical protein